MTRIKSLMLAIVAAALVGAGAFAQVDPPRASEPGGAAVTPTESMAQAQTPTPAQNTTTAPRDDGFDWGWVGLVGLIGLAGLRRPETRHVDRDAVYPTTRTDGTVNPRGVAH